MESDFLELIFELQLEQHEDPERVSNEAKGLYQQQRSKLEQEFEHWDSLSIEEQQLSAPRIEMILAKIKYLGNLFEE